MSFSVVFMGARVLGFQASVGWNLSGASQLTVHLVDDPATGAAFAPPPAGSPVYFTFFGFNFFGLYQRGVEKKGPDGNPVYEVTVTDPRELLEGAQVVLAGYTGPATVPNLFNAFGYWESGSFGAAGANDGGMPWWKVRDAVVAMANAPGGTSFGSPISFRGYKYSLDLSELPNAPAYYRVGAGVSMSLLELVAQVCEDGGCDFFVELRGFQIKVRTVSRAANPPLGVLSALASSAYGGTLVRSEVGVEVRNELTSAVVVGGEVTSLYLTGGLAQFWGFDPLGNPILGAARKQDVYEPLNTKLRQKDGSLQAQFLKKIGAVSYEEMRLNATSVSDVIGSLTYTCSTWEMRAAQTNHETWLAFVNKYRPELVRRLALPSPFNMDGLAAALLPGPSGNGVVMRNDMVAAGRANAAGMAAAAVAGDVHARSMRLYEFVRGTADEYMGRKFLVALPFLLTKTEPETLKATTSWEVTDGGYLPETSRPLGLSPLNEDLFKTQDGRYRAFCAFTNLAGVDLAKVPAHGAVVDGGALYMEVQVEPRVVYAPTPCVVVSLSGPVTETATDNVGDLNLLALTLGADPAKVGPALQNVPVPLKMAPAARFPAAVAVPLKSNVQTYGPWSAAGAPGKVRVEHDPSLTPWGYGGYAAMNAAAGARVQSAITSQQVFETGSRETAGAPPAAGLGDVLEAGGPNITNVSVQVGKDGVTTSYQFATFTPRAGALFSRGSAERFRRIGLAAAELRRGMRTALRDQQAVRAAARDAARAQKAFHQNQAKALKRETPSDVLVAYSTRDFSLNDKRVRVHAAMTTFEEAVTLSNAHDDAEWQKTAVMAMSGLVRPYSTVAPVPLGPRPSGADGPAPTGVAELATFLVASGLLTAWTAQSGALAWYAESGAVPRFAYGDQNLIGSVPSRSTLNPVSVPRANDVEVFSFGNRYETLHPYWSGVPASLADNARLLGVKAPLVLVGWGFDTNGRRVPSRDGGSSWHPDTNHRQDLWKAGPIDPLWDDSRGVWTVHGSVVGTILAPTGWVTVGGNGGSVEMYLGAGAGAETGTMTVHNWFLTPIAVSGSLRVMAQYFPQHNRYYITATDCAQLPGPIMWGGI